MKRMVDYSRTIEFDIHHCGGGGSPVAGRRATGCDGDSCCSGAACTGHRAGVVSLGSGNSARASRIMSLSAMLGAQRAA